MNRRHHSPGARSFARSQLDGHLALNRATRPPPSLWPRDTLRLHDHRQLAWIQHTPHRPRFCAFRKLSRPIASSPLLETLPATKCAINAGRRIAVSNDTFMVRPPICAGTITSSLLHSRNVITVTTLSTHPTQLRVNRIICAGLQTATIPGELWSRYFQRTKSQRHHRIREATSRPNGAGLVHPASNSDRHGVSCVTVATRFKDTVGKGRTSAPHQASTKEHPPSERTHPAWASPAWVKSADSLRHSHL